MLPPVLRSVETTENLSARLVLRQLAHTVKLTFRGLTAAGNEGQPIIVLSAPRTGSSLLSSLLSQHPGIYDCGEVLNQRVARGLYHRRFGPKAVVNHIRRSIRACGSNCALVKLHFNHLADRAVPLTTILESFPQASYILLYRQSILEQYCSQVLASRTRNFFSHKRASSSEVFHLNPGDWRVPGTATSRSVHSVDL
jgi:hypothetical protein